MNEISATDRSRSLDTPQLTKTDIALSGFDPNLEGDYSPDLRVSNFERFSAFLIASVLIASVITFLGFVLWLTSFEMRWNRFTGPPWETFEEVGETENPEGFAEDWQEPGDEEMPDQIEPQLLASALEAMTEAVSSVQAYSDDRFDDSDVRASAGFKHGDQRRPGIDVHLIKAVPEYQRWRVEYSTTSMADYRAQLEAFEIELGAVSKSTSRIDLVRDLTQEVPTRDTTSRSEEKRMYFSHTQRTLKLWDERICQQAGIDDMQDRIVVQFYGDTTRELLREIEAKYLAEQKRDVAEVQRTYFRLRPVRDGYEFYVSRIQYRPNSTL